MTKSDSVLTRAEFWDRHKGLDRTARTALHHEYYIQFATAGTRQLVRARIGTKAILASQDEHFNDIPLAKWDAMSEAVRSTVNVPALKAAEPCDKPKHYRWSLSHGVCIAKAVAREIAESEGNK